MNLIKFKSDWLLIAVLAVITLGVYYNSLWGDFIIDDYSAIVINDNVHNIKNYFSNNFSVKVGILADVEHLFIWSIFGANPFYFHLFNVLVHLCCVILFFILCNILFGKRELSFLTSLIFAVHPIHTEAVSWIAGGHYALSSLFFIASLIFYIKSDKSLVNLSLAIIFFCLCFLAGYAAAVLPVMFLLYDIFFREKREGDKLAKLRILLLCFVFLIAIIFVLRLYWERNKFVHLIFYFRGFRFLIVAAKAFVYYLKILYMPLQRGLYHPFAFDTFKIQKITPAFLLAIIIFVVSIAAFFRFRKSSKPLAFGIMWFYVTYIQYSNIIPICNIISERYIYLASFGFSIILACLFLKIWEIINKEVKHRYILRALAIAVIVLFVGSYASLTMKRNYDYHDIMIYWQSNINNFKEGYIVYNNLAGTFYAMGDKGNAIAYCWITLMVDPAQPHVWYNLGKVYKEIGELKQAEDCFINALIVDKNYIPAARVLEDLKNAK